MGIYLTSWYSVLWLTNLNGGSRSTLSRKGQIFLPHLFKKKSVCSTYLSLFIKQWDADRIHHLLRIDPPQRYFPWSKIFTLHGNAEILAVFLTLVLKFFDLSKSGYRLSPHFTKSSKKKEGQGPIVKVGWIARDLRIIPLLLAPPSSLMYRWQWLSQDNPRWETHHIKMCP